MAIKEKSENTKSRLAEILMSESKVLNYLVLALSIVVIILGVFNLNGTLEVKSTVPIIGSFPTTFAVILVVVGLLALVYSIYPFAKGAFPELKHVTWPSWALFLANTAKVFTFLIIFTLLYLMYDVLVSELISGILNIN